MSKKTVSSVPETDVKSIITTTNKSSKLSTNITSVGNTGIGSTSTSASTASTTIKSRIPTHRKVIQEAAKIQFPSDSSSFSSNTSLGVDVSEDDYELAKGSTGNNNNNSSGSSNSNDSNVSKPKERKKKRSDVAIEGDIDSEKQAVRDLDEWFMKTRLGER